MFEYVTYKLLLDSDSAFVQLPQHVILDPFIKNLPSVFWALKSDEILYIPGHRLLWVEQIPQLIILK